MSEEVAYEALTLNNAVSTGVLNEEWRAEYIIMHIHDMDMMEEGRIEGYDLVIQNPQKTVDELLETFK